MKGSSYILGGLLEGVGSSLVLAGAAKREAAHRMLELEMRNDEAARERAFTGEQNALNREHQSGEAAAGRTFTGEQNQLNRDHQGALQDDQQTFTADENAANRAATAANAAADRAHRDKWEAAADARADKDRNARLDEGQKERAWKAAEARIEREFKGNENAAERQSRFDAILLEEEGRERARQHDREMQDDDQAHDSAEGALDRDADVTETYDPNSPSGITLTPKGKAAGKPGVPTADQMTEQNAQAQREETAIRDRATGIIEEIDSADWWKNDNTEFGQGGKNAAIEQVADAIKAGKDKVVVNGRTIVLKGTEGDGGNASPSSESPAKQEPAADAEYPEAPKDPAQRKVGQVYRGANGKLGEWTGKGWKLVNG